MHKVVGDFGNITDPFDATFINYFYSRESKYGEMMNNTTVELQGGHYWILIVNIVLWILLVVSCFMILPHYCCGSPSCKEANRNSNEEDHIQNV
uniref:Uncharacterized protein n=1 Tax=Parastrongyloides trichosuri TaxID=131310 RepID=A0A0N4ZGH4_PARTI